MWFAVRLIGALVVVGDRPGTWQRLSVRHVAAGTNIHSRTDPGRQASRRAAPTPASTRAPLWRSTGLFALNKDETIYYGANARQRRRTARWRMRLSHRRPRSRCALVEHHALRQRPLPDRTTRQTAIRSARRTSCARPTAPSSSAFRQRRKRSNWIADIARRLSDHAAPLQSRRNGQGRSRRRAASVDHEGGVLMMRWIKWGDVRRCPGSRSSTGRRRLRPDPHHVARHVRDRRQGHEHRSSTANARPPPRARSSNPAPTCSIRAASST